MALAAESLVTLTGSQVVEALRGNFSYNRKILPSDLLEHLMPLEKIRILSVMIIAASIAAILSGGLSFGFFILQILATVPLWGDLDLDGIRDNRFWKMYGPFTLALFIGAVSLGISMKTSIFFLVFFCIIYEYYGEKRRSAPMRLLSLLSFLIVLYHARIENGLSLFFGILIYLFAIVFCLTSFHIGKLYDFNFSIIARKKLAPIIMHSILVFPLGLAIFWVMPRSPTQSLSAISTLGGDRLSGFSDRVTLNDIGSLKKSRKHVLDLKPLDGFLHSQYLKGKTLDQYNNGIWSYTLYVVSHPNPDENNVFTFEGQPDTREYRYRIDLEAIQGNTVFFADNLKTLRGNLSPLKMEGDLDQLSVLRVLPLAMSYVYTASSGPIPQKRRQGVRKYLQMPRNHEYFNEISQELLKDLPPDAPTEEKVRLLMRHLGTFTYTLDINNQGSDDPLKYFMLDQKQGHCELFASSMVMLLRSQGIPARLITGFLMPEIHPSGDFYYVTESDAHAWVEYLDDGFWHTIDPTPPGDAVDAAFFENQIAYLRRFWRNMVLSWDYDSQREFLDKAMLSIRTALNHVKDNKIFYTLLLALFCVPYYFTRFKPRFINETSRLKRSYQHLDRFLQKQFRERGTREGIFEYVNAIGLEKDLEQPLLTYLKDYHQGRFGRSDLSREQSLELTGRARDLLGQLKSRYRSRS